MWVAGIAASIEPSGGYLNRQPKVADEASCTFVHITYTISLIKVAHRLNKATI